MTEPDVVVTDYLLTAECMLLACLLLRQSSNGGEVRTPFIVFFVATGVASLLGGTVHGFFLAEDSRAGVLLWRAALITLGLAAWSGWVIGGRLIVAPGTARVIALVAAVESMAYAVVILAVNDSFWIAIANYLPAALFLTLALTIMYRATRRQAMAIGVVGLVATFVAAAIQHYRIAVHPVYFNHNTLYHVVQGAALIMIFWSARSLVHEGKEEAAT
jgi:hypothetical protein